MLLERENDLEALADALAAAHGGDGSVVVIEGPAGIGKSALLGETLARAEALGFTVLAAVASALEQEFAFGVARQLFELVVDGFPGPRERLFRGAAALAAPMFGAPVDDRPPSPPEPTPPSADRTLTVAHGLYWLTANLAGEAPLVIAVDDAQWSDSASTTFLGYLARRLSGLPVTLIVVVRSGEPQADGPNLAAVAQADGVRTIRPAPLDAAGVAGLVRAAMPGAVAPRFVEACLQATGGVPLLVNEVLAALAADGVQPTDAEAWRLSQLGPDAIVASLADRIRPFGPQAVSVAQAVAVLGRNAEVRHVAGVADLSMDDVSAQVDRLVAAHILTADRPLHFAHPVLATAAYADLAPGQLATRHARAAELLIDEEALAEDAAVHILLSEPAGNSRFVEALHVAARSADARAAPASAASYLRRALEEPAPTPLRPALLHLLGRVEAETGDPRAAEHLEHAARLLAESGQSVGVTADLVACHLFSGRWAEALTAARQVPPGHGDELDQTMLELLLAGLAAYDVRVVDYFNDRLPTLRELARGSSPAARGLALLLAGVLSGRMDSGTDALVEVRRALAGGPPALPGATIPQAVWSLLYADEVDAAAAVAAQMRIAADARGSMVISVCAAMLEVEVLGQRGDLRGVESEFPAAMEMILEHGLFFGLPVLLQRGLDALLERPALEPLRAVADDPRLEAALDQTCAGALVFEARGALRIASGRSEEGIADLGRCGELLTALGITHPMASQWRSRLALAVPATRAEEAAHLAATDLDLAHASGIARSIGVALRTCGLLRRGTEQLDLLLESSDVLAGAPNAGLELARSQVHLGAALRRAGRRADARAPLRAGLDLADRLGALRLADTAEEELRSAGARPRRRAGSGLDSLTPGEARVARLAAGPATARDIAESLFVSAKTVENQLTSVYRKLDVHSRDELRQALAHQPGE